MTNEQKIEHLTFEIKLDEAVKKILQNWQRELFISFEVFYEARLTQIEEMEISIKKKKAELRKLTKNEEK